MLMRLIETSVIQHVYMHCDDINCKRVMRSSIELNTKAIVENHDSQV